MGMSLSGVRWSVNDFLPIALVCYGFVAMFNFLITPIVGEGVPQGVDDGTVR